MLATPAEVANGRCIGQMEIRAARQTLAELPDLSRLHPRLARAGAALGATHFVIVSSAASTTSTPIVDFPNASSLVQARVELYVVAGGARAQGS